MESAVSQPEDGEMRTAANITHQESRIVELRPKTLSLQLVNYPAKRSQLGLTVSWGRPERMSRSRVEGLEICGSL